uniref:Uncharacterized protein n=1 Tax=Neobodo designis TaxID=312471 RepID=A0A7S1PWK8_NEODS|mmetsp:Transcript_21402/g.66406  ORF Transcript_21402/g.66406 Transcript_21402/m.66406 type:complete len:410 (+) Transcript_21402:2-1231(+)
MLLRRGLPAVAAASEQVIAEAVEALADLRELEAPAAQRGPRSEADGAPEERDSGRSSDLPTRNSDCVHLTWQLRRALLFSRRGDRACSLLHGDSMEGAKRQELLCNALCGAALAQTAVDADSAAWDAYAADVAQSLGVVTSSQSTAALHALVLRCRGHAVPAATGASMAERSTPKQAAPEPAPTNVLLPEKRVRAVEEPNVIYGMLAHARVKSAVLPALRNLPSAFFKGPAPESAILGRLHKPPPSVADCFKSSQQWASDVCCLAHIVRFRNGVLLVVTTIDGHPLYLSNGLKSNAATALGSFVSEQSSQRPASFGNLRDHCLALGPRTGFHADDRRRVQAAHRCVLWIQENGNKLVDKWFAGAERVMRGIRTLADWEQTTVPSRTTEPFYRWFRLLLSDVAKAIGAAK